MAQPNFLYWDIETSKKISAHFGSGKTYTNYRDLLSSTFIISGSWSWNDDQEVHNVNVLGDMERFKTFRYDVRDLYFDDYHCVKTLHEQLCKADVVVAHHGNYFDWRWFTGRVIFHGLPPIPPKMRIDTYLAVRKIAQFDYLKLDHLCATLELGRKLETDKDLWLEATLGDPDAIKRMSEYNNGDIDTLRQLYKTIRPYMYTHPNLGLFAREIDVICSVCASHDVVFHDLIRGGKSGTGHTVKKQYRCNECGTYLTGRQSIKGVELRK